MTPFKFDLSSNSHSWRALGWLAKLKNGNFTIYIYIYIYSLVCQK